MCCSTTECLNTDRSGPRKKVQHSTVRKPVAKNRKQCFPDSVGGRTKRSSLRSLKASTPVGSSYNSHDFRSIASLRVEDSNTAFLKGSSNQKWVGIRRGIGDLKRERGGEIPEREKCFAKQLGNRYSFRPSGIRTEVEPDPTG